LVVVEIASALVLVITSALIFAGGRRLANQASGFDSDHTLAIDVRLPQKTYETPDAQRNLAARLIDEIAPLPAVESVALASVLPASGWSPESAIAIEGEPELESAQRPHAGHRIVSPGYFETLRIPLRGRDFSARDRPGSEPVAIISATMARRYWPGQDPIGRRVRMERFDNEWLTIVGVVGDTRMFNWWDGEENLSAVYVPLDQRPFGGTLQLAVRTLTHPVSVSGSARNALAAIDPLFALRVRTMQQAIAECGLGLTYLATLLAVCSGVALVLSIIGIYSLMAYEVSQRTHEFGVRMALGATSSRVLRMTLGQAGTVTLFGILAGVALAFALTEVIASALAGIVSVDPSLFLAASAALATVSLIAAWLPAHRATKVDPLIALRSE
jgi:putative ABC transport system permease protein